MTYEFIPPEFVEGSAPEEIQMRMMKSLPKDIDDMPGGFPYDFTMPTALEKAELIQFHLVRALMTMFPQFAWGQWLDYHGQQTGTVRKAANHASGYVTFKGVAQTVIPEKLIVCTPAANDKPAIEFYTDQEAVIPDKGIVTVAVTAVNPGNGSNVPKNTISLMAQPLKGIESLVNAEEISGGADGEDDESYRERILEYHATDGESFIGNDSDLKRWAKEVPGIGDCIVVPTWNGPGTVKLVLVDANGQPANKRLIQAVYDHIVSPDNRAERLLPAGSALLTVTAADTMAVHFAGWRLTLEEGFSLEQVIEDFKAAVLKYFVHAKEEGVVRYNEVHALLTQTNGVVDFVEFTMNKEKSNIVLKQDEYPEIADVHFSV